MQRADFDAVIVGQGLAGTALAWALIWAGSRVLIVDRNQPGTASRIAAGLITPITGQRLVRTWRWNDFWPTAVSFYRRIEVETGCTFFQATRMVRLFVSAEERKFYQQRTTNVEFQELVRSPPTPSLSASYSSPQGEFEMLPAGQLDTATYLAASRDFFVSRGESCSAELDLEHDVQFRDQILTLRGIGVRTKRLIFCQGVDAMVNPWFRPVRLKPAKGEILTVQIPGLSERRVVHRGIWIAPAGHERFRVGSTYEWKQLDRQPTAAARNEIESQLREILPLPFEVVEHLAAVRPIHRNQYPVLGLHPTIPQLGYLNGLGSKGALHAPWLALHFADVLRGTALLDPDVDLNRKTDWRE